jgi:AhpC/TSA family
MLGLVLAGCTGHVPAPTAPAAATPTTQTADTTRGWVGKTAMGFTLPDQDGRSVDVSKILGTRPVVLVFYRGVW